MNVNELFPDEEFAKAIERRFNFSKNPKSAIKKMKILEELHLDKLKIENIEGVQIFENLKILILSKNKITDITPLSSLTNLTELYLEKNKIKDFTPIKDLTNLTRLFLKSNKCKDISFPKLSNLKILYLGHESDLTTLTLMKNLKILDIGDEVIGSRHLYSTFPKLSNLEKMNAFLRHCDNLEDYSFVANLPELKLLTFYSLK